MSGFEVWNRANTHRLTTLHDWCRYTKPPKRHWKAAASAFELAREWTSGLGLETLNKWAAGSAFRSLDARVAVAEAQTRFDKYPGGVRNHDLLLRAESELGPVAISIESKVADTFGQRIRACLAYADRRIAENKRTNMRARVDALTLAFAGATPDEEPDLCDVRYQLFTGAAGAMAAAQEADAPNAVMLVRQFETSRLSDKAERDNKRDLGRFLERCFDTTVPVSPQWLLGPFAPRYAEDGWAKGIQLWFGFHSTKPEPFDPQADPRWNCYEG